MDEFLGWFDDSPKKPVQTKISEAVERFTYKFGYPPDICLVNERDLIEYPGVMIRPQRHIRPNYFWVGREELASLGLTRAVDSAARPNAPAPSVPPAVQQSGTAGVTAPGRRSRRSTDPPVTMEPLPVVAEANAPAIVEPVPAPAQAARRGRKAALAVAVEPPVAVVPPVAEPLPAVAPTRSRRQAAAPVVVEPPVAAQVVPVEVVMPAVAEAQPVRTRRKSAAPVAIMPPAVEEAATPVEVGPPAVVAAPTVRTRRKAAASVTVQPPAVEEVVPPVVALPQAVEEAVPPVTAVPRPPRRKAAAPMAVVPPPVEEVPPPAAPQRPRRAAASTSRPASAVQTSFADLTEALVSETMREARPRRKRAVGKDLAIAS